MLGAFSDYRLAPMAMHGAQEALGTTSRHWAAGLIQTYYRDSDGRLALFTRRDVGGCTAGGYKAIGHHVIEGAIDFGVVGRSLSAYIDCRRSYDIYKKILILSPNFLQCDNTNCPTCYGSPMVRHPLFWTRKLGNRLYRKVLSFAD